MKITWYGYDYSGLPSYGLGDDDCVYVRSYMLWDGLRPKEWFGPAQVFAPLTDAAAAALRSELAVARCELAAGLIVAAAIASGSTIRIIDPSGSHHLVSIHGPRPWWVQSDLHAWAA